MNLDKQKELWRERAMRAAETRAQLLKEQADALRYEELLASQQWREDVLSGRSFTPPVPQRVLVRLSPVYQVVARQLNEDWYEGRTPKSARPAPPCYTFAEPRRPWYKRLFERNQ